MFGQIPITLERDVNVVYVPDGTPGTLPMGEVVLLQQSLGNSHTVTASAGRMARIAAYDADALGLDPPAPLSLVEGADAASVEQNVWTVLRTIYDPEIPVNIAELGLVYGCQLTPEEGGFDVAITMTLTAPACGMGPVLQYDVEESVRRLPGVGRVRVDVVFDPPWSRERMSDVARLQLGML